MYLMFSKQYSIASREYAHAKNVFHDVCMDGSKIIKYGRFNQCDEVHIIMAQSVILVALDRATTQFLDDLKNNAFKDLTHVGYLLTFVATMLCLMVYIMYCIYRSWHVHSMESTWTKAPKSKEYLSLKID